MPVFHSKQKLELLLMQNNISLTDAVKRGKFYQEHFDWKQLSKIYTQGGSIKSICKETGLSYDAVRVNLKRQLETLRPFSVKDRSTYYFSEELLFPLTNRGAYLLGWLYSDGCVTKNKITVTLQGTDFSHLAYIFSLFTNKPVIINNKGNAQFDYFSVSLSDSLTKEYNLIHRKSFENFTIPLSKFSNDNIPYLILGLLEGDGSISKSCLNCQLLVTASTWECLRCYLWDFIDLSKVTTHELNAHGLLSVDFRGVSYFSLLQYIYLNTKEVQPLQRKFNSFITQLNRSAKGRTSPYKKLAVSVRDSLVSRNTYSD